MLIAGALVFNYVVTVENIPNSLARFMAGYDLSPSGFLLLVNIILLILGCLLEGSTILLVVVPIFIPTAKALGIDLVHFGVVVRRQHHDRAADAALRAAAVRPRQHDQAAAARDRARGRAVHRLAIIVLAIITFVPGHGPLAAAADGLQGLSAGSVTQKAALMTKPIYVLNGPNLNRLGTREPQIYGTTTLAEVEAMCRAEAAGGQPIEFRQTNSETQLIDWMHEAIDEGAGIIINPAAYTFTSIAILDALKMFPGPIIELHISNIHKREAIYHHSLGVEGRDRGDRRARRQGLSGCHQFNFGAAEISGQCGTSIMGLMMLTAGPGITITIHATGPEAAAAVDALCALIAARFGEED